MKKFKPYDGMIVYDRQGNECVVKFHIKTKNDPNFWPSTHWRVEGGELGGGFSLDYALEEGLIQK